MRDIPASGGAPASAADIAAAVASGRATATSVIEATLAHIRERDPLLNSFTAVTEQRALRRAKAIDAARARREQLGPLAGVPFAVKNLFDIAGLTTLAGSKINRDNPAAKRDAALIERLEAAGAVLVGALNMGEYAYDFTGENVHDGASRNPHDLNRMSGGSSGGSGSSVGGGLVPLALGSDTNGSIRVPASLCGIFGLKPTYGRLSRARSFPFVASFDHLGPLARSVRDLTLAYDAMQGFDLDDPISPDEPIEPVMPLLDRGTKGLRIAVASGYFKCLNGETSAAVDRVASALGVNRDIDIPQAERARAAAFVITAAEGSSLHVVRLRKRAGDFASGTRDRLIAGALTPAHYVIKAQKFRGWYRDQVLKLFNEVDAIITPATPCTAPLLGQRMFKHGDAEIPVAGSLGLYTQPFSFIGLPAVVVPVPLDPLPMGVQIVAAPWREDVVLRLAHALEAKGVVAAKIPAV